MQVLRQLRNHAEVLLYTAAMLLPTWGRGIENHFSMHLAAHEVLVRVPIRVRGEQKCACLRHLNMAAGVGSISRKLSVFPVHLVVGDANSVSASQIGDQRQSFILSCF